MVPAEVPVLRDKVEDTMKRFLVAVLTLSLPLLRVGAQAQLPAAASRTMDYAKDVKPITQ